MKIRKLYLLILITVLFLLIGASSVNAETIDSIDDWTRILGDHSVIVEGNLIKLKDHVTLYDGIKIENGNYIIDLNGHNIRYNYKAYKTVVTEENGKEVYKTVLTNNFDSVFVVDGGNLTIKNSSADDALISSYNVVSAKNGTITIENGNFEGNAVAYNEGKIIINNGHFYKAENSGEIYLSASGNATLEINNGRFDNCLLGSSGTHIINGGLFNGLISVPYEYIPTFYINGGTFIYKHAAPLLIWTGYSAKNTVLKGGTFITLDNEDGAIDAYYQNDEPFDLNSLLADGYRFSNDEQLIIEHNENEYSVHSWETKSAKEVTVVKDDSKDLRYVTFLDEDGNIIDVKYCENGKAIENIPVLEKEGYVFEGWNSDLNAVFDNLTVSPVFKKILNFKVDWTYYQTYTGNEIKPEINVYDEETNQKLQLDIDYKVEYFNNIDVGNAGIIVTGIGDYKYSETFKQEFDIISKRIDDKNTKVFLNNTEFTYTGNDIIPEIRIECDGVELIVNKDYTVTYSNNNKVGNARISIIGIGNYTGNLFSGFSINPIQLTENDVIINTSDRVYTGSLIEPEVNVIKNNKTLTRGSDYSVYYTNNYTIGTATVSIVGNGNYAGKITRSFNIVKPAPTDINRISVSVDTNNKQYTGNSITTSIVLKNGNYTLVNGKDYTVSYSNNKNYGTATVTITGIGDYTGKITKSFNIIPKKINISTLKNTILRCVFMSWNKDSKVSGYEIYRSKNANSGYSKVKTISQNWITSYTFAAQAKGTYYYKIRTYVTVNGVKLYSDFSNVVSVKVTR